jgi:hypothetical protein
MEDGAVVSGKISIAVSNRCTVTWVAMQSTCYTGSLLMLNKLSTRIYVVFVLMYTHRFSEEFEGGWSLTENCDAIALLTEPRGY